MIRCPSLCRLAPAGSPVEASGAAQRIPYARIARPPLLEVNVSQLNPRQQEAVRYISGPLLVLAGAGSGKTSVITRKIAYLVKECGIRAQHLVCRLLLEKKKNAETSRPLRIGRLLT